MNAASAAAVRKNVTLANGLLTNNGFYFVVRISIPQTKIILM